MSYYNRIQKMIQELREHPKISIEYCRFEPVRQRNMNSATIREVKEKLGTPLPFGIEDFFREIQHFEIKWRITAPELLAIDNYLTCGEIKISNITSLFGRPFEPFYNQTPSLLPIDYPTGEYCVGYNLKEDQTFPQSLSYAYFCDIYDLQLNFPEYFNRLMNSRGYCHWATGLIPPNSYSNRFERFPDNSEFQNLFEQILPRLFLDYDKTLLAPKIDK